MPDALLAERARPRRGLGQATTSGALQVATALLAARVGIGLVRAAGRLLKQQQRSPDGARVAPEPAEGFDSEDEDGPAPAAREQWQPCADPPPPPPRDARLVASADLPVSVYCFYEQFLSSESTCLQDFHRSTGQTHFGATRWRADAGGGLSRVFTFVQPKKGLASMPTRCTQRQRLSVHAGGVLSLMTDTQAFEIPCADQFRVQSFWTACPAGPGPAAGCRVEVRVAVPFRGWSVLKPVITSASMADCREFFEGFLEKVARGADELAPAARGAAAPAEPHPHRARPRHPPAHHELSLTTKTAFAVPPPPALGGLRALVGLHTLLLAALLLLQAVLLWELFALRSRLAAALPGAFPAPRGLLLGAHVNGAGGAAGAAGLSALSRGVEALLLGAFAPNGHGAHVREAEAMAAPGGGAE
ncbi:hypothetical protein Rsub_11749 [Raphidocelis subcapitata]|uniref:VASt domain-containing protein n=1 Tax=Raphidocelis subcapitata TaxID=307507 RepID=A0A2V0PPE4_9CHLO|nr:hypothetical protein Rsub_11749 [Raphidocelis subcapitata]|eukprot:GBF99337.1 hypothetical protein Rsub_11749 [Raphidocelis subcapitata]